MTAATMSPPAAAALPSAFDLSRHYHQLWVQLGAIDAAKLQHKDGGPERRALDRAWTRLEEEADALDNLILSRPTSSLADALAVTVHLHGRIECASESWNSV